MTESLLRRTAHSVAPLQWHERFAVTSMLLEDPVMNVVPLMYLEGSLGSGKLHPQLMGLYRRHGLIRKLKGVVWSGSNLSVIASQVEVTEHADIAVAVADAVMRPASIVGEAQLTMGLWEYLQHSWSPVRELRAHQPSMVIDGPPAPIQVSTDIELEEVRLAVEDDFAALLPACVHMFTAEVGYNPLQYGRELYESRVRSLIRLHRSYVQYGLVGGQRQIVFKCEIGALAAGVAQLQGVWVHPELRGEGLGRAGISAAVARIQTTTAPVISLYVNDFNAPARRAYEAVGFVEDGAFATIMF